MEKKRVLLDGTDWCMRSGEGAWRKARVPGSVYTNLLETGEMENPYFGENEYQAIEIAKRDYEFEKTIVVKKEELEANQIDLVFEGIDTLTEIYWNETKIAETENMHRIYRFPIKQYLKEGKNTLRVHFHSALEYVQKKHKERPIWGVDTTVGGFSQLRKAHYMFGWDWGPVLADMGFYRSVALDYIYEGEIRDVFLHQEHRADGTVLVQCNVESLLFSQQDAQTVQVQILSPDGKVYQKEQAAMGNDRLDIEIADPQLWWPNGIGDQPLYQCSVCLKENDGTRVDERKLRIGLRTLVVSREKDQWGEEFCFQVNGQKIFAMGGNYVPEDNLLTYCNDTKTKKLIETCKDAHFNCIRVWGGGLYQSDYFYELCDENGLIVWQDFMYACASYWLTKDFRASIIEETRDQIKRLRHHASIGLWCGNNEIESAWVGWGIPQEPDLQEDYQEIFENILPQICKELDPDRLYWPSSPSTEGGFRDPSCNDRGDQHYWDVWHGMKPTSDFEKYYFRFCSEYGFVSLPSIKTIEAFTEKKDRNLCSPVMELHHRCVDGNKKLLYYISDVMRYPNGLQELIYASQLLQADAIKANVEHMRRHRGRCMGSVYWQINDSNPCISWSSIDYFGRWKALQYYAKKFYAPVAASFVLTDADEVKFYVTNETQKKVSGTLIWKLRNARADILQEGAIVLSVPEFSTKIAGETELSAFLATREQKRNTYMEYAFVVDAVSCSSATTLFVPCKAFDFLQPHLDWEVRQENGGYVLHFTSDVFTKGVYLECADADVIFSDNWFDINGKETVTVHISAQEATRAGLQSEEDVCRQLRIMTANQIGRI